MCRKRFVLEEQACLLDTHRLGWEDWPLGPPFCLPCPRGPMLHLVPLSLSLPHLLYLIGPEGEERTCLLSSRGGGCLEVRCGAQPGTRHSAPKPGSLGKPELRPLQQGFLEMFHLLCTPSQSSQGRLALEGQVVQDPLS